MDTPIVLECLQSAYTEVVDNEDASVLSSGPKPVSYATIQHVNDLDPIADLELPVQPVP